MLRYTPILKGKQGELEALSNTVPSLKTVITPLIEISPISPKYIPGENDPVPSKTVDAHVAAVGHNLTEALKDYSSVYVDGFYIEEEDDLEDGTEPSAFVFSVLRKAQISFIPVIGLDRVDQYAASVKIAVNVDQRGCCLRLNAVDLDNPPKILGDLIGSLLKELEIEVKDVDLLIDYGPSVPLKSGLLLQLNALPLVTSWRTLTFAASSFPSDMSQISPNSIAEIERKEWAVWNYLRSNADSLTRMPDYADYAINHPVLSDVDPRVMRLSPNIRYTGTVNYLLAKGSAYPRLKDKTKKANTKASDQYPILAKAVIAHPAWRGAEFSWGDGYIDACSRKECVGNSTNWRSVGTSHHLASVAHQLASLLELE